MWYGILYDNYFYLSDYTFTGIVAAEIKNLLLFLYNDFVTSIVLLSNTKTLLHLKV